MDEIRANKSNGRILLGLILCCGFVAVGAWLAGLIGESHAFSSNDGMAADIAAIFNTDAVQVEKIAGWICMLVFGVFALLHIRLLLTTGPAIIVDQQGLWMARWRSPVVDWDQVERLSQISAPGQRSFGVFLKPDARTVMGRKTPKLSQPDFVLNLVGTKTNFNTVYDYVKLHHPELLRV